MISLRSTFLRTAAAAALVFGFAGSADAALCRDWTDCVKPLGENSFEHLQPTGCWVSACTRPDATVCNTPQNQPVDPSCSCAYDFAENDLPCQLTSCGQCTDGQCVSSDTDQDGSCVEDDLCPELATLDDGDADGDDLGDPCDPNDTLVFSVRTFQVSASKRDIASGRPNGKIQVKGQFAYGTSAVSEIAVIVGNQHPSAPFDQRWLLPCTKRGTRTLCESRTDRTGPWIRATLKTSGAMTSFDFKAQNLPLTAVPTLTPADGVGPDKYLPAVQVVLPANWQFPLDDYLTSPTPITGIDLIRNQIGHAPEGWRCRLLPSVGTPTKLACTNR